MLVFDHREAAERAVAGEIAALVRAQPTAVLGLATGDTPAGVYRELVRLHRTERLDLTGVRVFNLDEYVGLTADDRRSFRFSMRERLFRPASMAPAQTRFPDGEENGVPVAAADLPGYGERFEQAIRDAGGIDLQLLGIGRNGHIGFNEPGSTADTRTRLVALHASTRHDAAAACGGLDRVPTEAITMGVGTILEARRIRVLAFGARKREVVARTLASPPDPAWPVSLLHGHPDVQLIVDAAAVSA